MTDEILKGYITNDRFVWKANKGACKKCTSMDDKMFVNKNTFHKNLIQIVNVELKKFTMWIEKMILIIMKY